MGSLRRKIVIGYAVIAALVVGLALLSLLELRLVQAKIRAGERVAELFDVALEIRRFEKNYFLYRQATDLAENAAYLARARTLLREQAQVLEALTPAGQIGRLDGRLERYGGLMAEYAAGTPGPEPSLESAIRQAGKEIVTFAERLAGAEREALQAQLDRHRRWLVASLVLVTLVVAATGHLLTRGVVHTLGRVERSMQAVAAGRLAKLDLAARDREIASLTAAFNLVLEKLELRQGQLVRAEKLAALGTLLSGVAHELNNPLSNVSTSCQILAEELEEGDLAFQRELIGQIDEETWRARRIVRSLLDYARNRDFRAESLALAPLVEDTLRLIRGRIGAQVGVTTRIPPDLQVAGDKQRLQQLLLNLVGNALDALEGAGEVQVAARLTDAPLPPHALVFGQCPGPGPALELEVRDNGHGIPEELLPRVLDPFFTTKAVGQGLGLGLFIGFEIVEEHGGCMAVASTPGQGSAFFVRLPPDRGAKNA